MDICNRISNPDCGSDEKTVAAAARDSYLLDSRDLISWGLALLCCG